MCFKKVVRKLVQDFLIGAKLVRYSVYPFKTKKPKTSCNRLYLVAGIGLEPITFGL